jgi:hypothetical protein
MIFLPLEKFVAQASMLESVLPSFEILLIGFCTCLEPGYMLRCLYSISGYGIFTTPSIALRLRETFTKQAWSR